MILSEIRGKYQSSRVFEWYDLFLPTHQILPTYYYFLIHNDREWLNNLSLKEKKFITTRSKGIKLKPKLMKIIVSKFSQMT